MDMGLRPKLARWFSAAVQARLPYACCRRGLGGRSLPTAQCRARLCHFERYWHMPGVDLLEEDADLLGESESLAAAGSVPDAARVDVQMGETEAMSDEESLDG